MRTGLMLAIIFLPFIGGTFLQVISFPSKKAKEIYIFSYVLLNTILTYVLLAQGTTDYTMLINFAGEKLIMANCPLVTLFCVARTQSHDKS